MPKIKLSGYVYPHLDLDDVLYTDGFGSIRLADVSTKKTPVYLPKKLKYKPRKVTITIEG